MQKPMRAASIAVSLLFAAVANCETTGTLAADKLTSYGKRAWQESVVPVRPGKPGERPFWNEHAKRFIYAPAFDFKAVDGASKYNFSLKSDKLPAPLQFEADVPYAPVTEVWDEVPVGKFEIVVTGLAEDGTTVGVAGSKESYRAAPFNGLYHEPPVMELDDSATLALKNLLHKDYVNYWFEHKKPDPGYRLYQYPSKIHGALVIGAITQAHLTSGTEEGKRSEELAKIIADYLLTIRFPEGSAYEYMVPTYHGPHMAKVKKKHMVVENHMTIMGVDAGTAFLDLYDLTGDVKYLDAAKKIAQTYIKTQNEQGTWPLFVEWESGKQYSHLIAIPTAMINYFDRLARDHSVQGLEEAKNKALHYVMENPVKTFNWQGQFEDIVPVPEYENHSREQACDLAIYLMRNNTQLDLAKDLIRFAEDQFVIWEQPRPISGRRNANPGFDSSTWITPSVQEQYVFWTPVGRSAGIMIDTFWEAYKTTGDELYLAKAKSIANSFTAVQKLHSGDYPTFFTPHKMNFWLNSVVYPSKVLMNLNNNMKQAGK